MLVLVHVNVPAHLSEVTRVCGARRGRRRRGFSFADHDFVVFLQKHRLGRVVVLKLFAKEKRQVFMCARNNEEKGVNEG